MTHFTFLDLKDIAEREAFLLNSTTPEKVLAAGRSAGMKPGTRVIDFGCGFGAALSLWGEQFGVCGIAGFVSGAIVSDEPIHGTEQRHAILLLGAVAPVLGSAAADHEIGRWQPFRPLEKG